MSTAPDVVSRESNASWGHRHRQFDRAGQYAYLVPFFGLFAIFGLFPLLYTGFVSLNSVDLQTSAVMRFVGLANYAKLLSDPFFWNAVRTSFTLGFLAVGPQLAIALVVAHLLNYRLRGQTFWRVAVLMPYATSVAAATLLFSQFYAYDHGLVNYLLGLFGIDKVDWQAGTWTSQLAIASIVTWRWTGYNALIYLAAMGTIDPELYEAAAIDGASKWRQFIWVTIPGIRPTILFTIVISTIGALQLFTEPLLYGSVSFGIGPQGGVSRQYQTLVLYMYQQGWTYYHLGYAATIAIAVLLLVILMVAINGFIAATRLSGK
jgi:cellobiose transport system permease protein